MIWLVVLAVLLVLALVHWNQEIRRSIALRITLGGLGMLLGLALYLWVRNHSPHMGLGEAMMNLNNYIINEPAYSLIIIIAAGLGLGGIVVLLFAVRARR